MAICTYMSFCRGCEPKIVRGRGVVVVTCSLRCEGVTTPTHYPISPCVLSSAPWGEAGGQNYISNKMFETKFI